MNSRVPVALIAIFAALAIEASVAQDSVGSDPFGGAMAGDALEFLLPIGKEWTHVRAPSYVVKGYNLSLVSVNSIEELAVAGASSVIVAKIGASLHIRIFDHDGTITGDKAEAELPDGKVLKNLKLMLAGNPFPAVSEFSSEEKQEIVKFATALSNQPDKKDVLQSILLSEKVTRRRDHVLDLEDMTMAVFEANGTVSLRMTTAMGEYDLDEEILKSRQHELPEPKDVDEDGEEDLLTRTKIEHPEFDMWGDVLIFNAQTQQGTLLGNVRMVIYDSDTEMMPMPGGSGETGSDAETDKPGEGSGAAEAPQPEPANDKTEEETS